MLKENKQSYSKRGSKNPQWKGNDVGYSKLHAWVISRFPKTKKCNHCKVQPPRDLANKGIYNRDLKNWEWLCRQCHMKSDGRLKNFLSHRRSMPKGNQYYLLVKNRLKGDTHPVSKLKEKEVLLIREMYTTGEYTLQQLAEKFSVCFQSISLIVNRKTWKHV